MNYKTDCYAVIWGVARSCLVYGVIAFSARPSLANSFLLPGQDLITISAGSIIEYNSNIFRRASEDQAGATGGLSDLIKSANISAEYSKELSQQQWSLATNYTHYWYQDHPNLDFSGLNYDGKLALHLFPQLQLLALAQRSEQPNDYANFQSNVKNIRRSESYSAGLDWNFAGGWHPFAKLIYNAAKNSSAFVEDNSRRSRGYEGGLRYEFPSGTKFSATYTSQNGSFPVQTVAATKQLDSSYQQKKASGKIEWPLTGKSKVFAESGYNWYQYPIFTERNISKPFGSITYSYLATERLQVNLNASTAIQPFTGDYSSYLRSENVGLALKFEMSPYVMLTAAGGYGYLRYGGDVVNQGLFDSWASHQTSGKLGLDWQPYQMLRIGLDSSYIRRTDANAPFVQAFDQSQISVSLEVLF